MVDHAADTIQFQRNNGGTSHRRARASSFGRHDTGSERLRSSAGLTSSKGSYSKRRMAHTFLDRHGNRGVRGRGGGVYRRRSGSKSRAGFDSQVSIGLRPGERIRRNTIVAGRLRRGELRWQRGGSSGTQCRPFPGGKRHVAGRQHI